MCDKNGDLRKWEEFSTVLCRKVLPQTIDSMLHNLDYGIHAKEVTSSTKCLIKLAGLKNFDEDALVLLFHLLQIG